MRLAKIGTKFLARTATDNLAASAVRTVPCANPPGEEKGHGTPTMFDTMKHAATLETMPDMQAEHPSRS